MALKTSGKRRAGSVVDFLADSGNDDAQDVVEARKATRELADPTKMKLPPSVALERIRRHSEKILAMREKLGIPAGDFRDEYCELVRAVFSSGIYLTNGAAADLMGMPLSTFNTWREKYPNFADAVDRGLAWQETNLSNRAIEDRVNVAGVIMTMKNSAHRWKDKIEHDIGENMASLVRRAEESRRVVQWTDLGSHGTSQTSANQRPSVIDVSVSKEPTNNASSSDADAAQDGDGEAVGE